MCIKLDQTGSKVPKGPIIGYRNWLTSGRYSKPASARVRVSSALSKPSAAQSSSRSGYWSRSIVLMRLNRMNGSMGIGV